jgi:GT2 family glycosyltransferase
LLSVLVVSWNTCEFGRQCIDAALALDGTISAAVEVVAVDNGSSDGTADMLTDCFGGDPRVTLILNERNEGFAAANNQALLASRGDVIAVVNPDVQLRPRAVQRLLDLVARPDVGLASCALVGSDGRPQAIHRELPTISSVFWNWTRVGAFLDYRIRRGVGHRRYRLVHRPRLGIMNVGQVAGALLFVRRQVIEQQLAGLLFNERFPILMNDVDLSRRVLDQGLRVIVDWDEWLTHTGGVSLRQVDPILLRSELWTGLQQYFREHGSPVERLSFYALCRLPQLRRSTTNASEAKRAANSESPLVSIIIPCHNYADLLAEAIDSALLQSWPKVEIAVVDDGTIDRPDTVVARYGPMLTFIRQENRGLSAARNVGARWAAGQFLIFLDADDRLGPDFASRCVEALQDHPTAGFAYTQTQYFGTATGVTTLAPYSLDRLIEGNEVSATALIRAELVRQFPYHEGNRIGWEDWDFYLTLAENGWGGVLVDEVHFEYRRHPCSMTAVMTHQDRRRLLFMIGIRHWQLVGLLRVIRRGLAYLRSRVRSVRSALNRLAFP